MRFSVSRFAVLLATGALWQAAPAHAQARLSIGPRVGFNLSGAPYKDERQNKSYDTTFRPGVEAGLQASAQFGKWAVQPALLYSQKGFNIDDNSTTVLNGETLTIVNKNTHRFDYLTLPLNVVYSLQADGQGLQLFAGPYLSMLLGGEQKVDFSYSYRNATSSGGGHYDYTAEVKAGDYYSDNRTVNTYESRRFDAGLQAGLGYRFGPAQVQLGYSLGLRNLGAAYRFYSGINTQVEPGPSYRNRVLQASVAYLFGQGS